MPGLSPYAPPREKESLERSGWLARIGRRRQQLSGSPRRDDIAFLLEEADGLLDGTDCFAVASAQLEDVGRVEQHTRMLVRVVGGRGQGERLLGQSLGGVDIASPRKEPCPDRVQGDLRGDIGAPEARASLREEPGLVVLALLKKGPGERRGDSRQDASLADLLQYGVSPPELLLGRRGITDQHLDVIRDQRVAADPDP